MLLCCPCAFQQVMKESFLKCYAFCHSLLWPLLRFPFFFLLVHLVFLTCAYKWSLDALYPRDNPDFLVPIKHPYFPILGESCQNMNMSSYNCCFSAGFTLSSWVSKAKSLSGGRMHLACSAVHALRGWVFMNAKVPCSMQPGILHTAANWDIF